MTGRIETFVNDALSSLIRGVRALFESVEDISERETKAAVELGKNVAEANVGDEYAKIEAARIRYVKVGISGEEALKGQRRKAADAELIPEAGRRILAGNYYYQ